MVDAAKIAEHTPLPWRVEQDTDLIWGACNPDDSTSYGMGYAIVEGRSGWASWAKGRPDLDEREANAAFIVRACNSHYELVEALELLVEQKTAGFFTEYAWDAACAALSGLTKTMEARRG